MNIIIYIYFVFIRPLFIINMGNIMTGLGPPDLCHVTKVQEIKQSLLRSAPVAPALLGSYHHVYGVDCSSAAGVAAYFNTLMNDMPNPHMSKV